MVSHTIRASSKRNKIFYQVVICDEARYDPESFDEDILTFSSDFRFDPDKCVCTAVRENHTLVHSSGGRGYGMLVNSVAHGCFKWKVRLLFRPASTDSKVALQICLRSRFSRDERVAIR